MRTSLVIWRDPYAWGFIAFLLVLAATRGTSMPALAYRLAQILLVAAVVVLGCCVILYAGLFGPWGWAGALALIAALFSKRGNAEFTTLGSGRWATRDDIAHMLDAATGLCVGVLEVGRQSLVGAVRTLFSPRVTAEAACRAVLDALSLRVVKPAVRLSEAVHTVVFAPPGAGKSTCLAIPFVLSLAFGHDSAFVIDVKGEIARIAAPVLRAFGVKVYILDPHRIVTQNPDTYDPVRCIIPRLAGGDRREQGRCRRHHHRRPTRT
jgi:type IV secretion system protein VirD4